MPNIRCGAPKKFPFYVLNNQQVGDAKILFVFRVSHPIRHSHWLGEQHGVQTVSTGFVKGLPHRFATSYTLRRNTPWSRLQNLRGTVRAISVPNAENKWKHCPIWRTVFWGSFDSAKNHKRQRRKRQSVTAVTASPNEKSRNRQSSNRLGQVRLS